MTTSRASTMTDTCVERATQRAICAGLNGPGRRRCPHEGVLTREAVVDHERDRPPAGLLDLDTWNRLDLPHPRTWDAGLRHGALHRLRQLSIRPLPEQRDLDDAANLIERPEERHRPSSRELLHLARHVGGDAGS